MYNAERSKQRYDARKQQGLCVTCPTSSLSAAADGHVMCAPCLVKYNAAQVRKMKKRKEDGNCIHCGREMTEDDRLVNTAKYTCFRCQHFQAIRTQRMATGWS